MAAFKQKFEGGIKCQYSQVENTQGYSSLKKQHEHKHGGVTMSNTGRCQSTWSIKEVGGDKAGKVGSGHEEAGDTWQGIWIFLVDNGQSVKVCGQERDLALREGFPDDLREPSSREAVWTELHPEGWSLMQEEEEEIVF